MKQTDSVTIERPPALSALCILTFIGSTAGFAGFFLSALFYEQVTSAIIRYSSWHTTEAISPFFFILLMVFHALSLVGAIRMWKLYRNGFSFYLVSQIAILLTPVVWTGWDGFSYTNFIFTIVFCVSYGLNLKHMK